MRLKIVLPTFSLLIAMILVAGYVFLHFQDYSHVKTLIEQLASDASGRRLVIHGDLTLTPSLAPELETRDVTLENASWGSQTRMLSIGLLKIRLKLLPLLRGDIEFENIRLIDTRLLLESGASGQSNWNFTPINTARAELTFKNLDINRLGIENLAVSFRDGKSGSEEQHYALDSLELSESSDENRLTAKLEGSVHGQPLMLAGSIGLLRTLFSGSDFPIDLAGNIAGAPVSLTGSIGNVPDLTDIDLKVNTSGDDLAQLGSFVGRTWPASGPFTVNGRIRGSGSRLALSEAQGAISRQGIRLKLSGSIDNLLHLGGVNLEFETGGKHFSALGALFDLDTPLPEAGAFSLHGKLSGSASEFEITDFSANIDSSDFNGWATMRSGEKPKITVRLEAGLIDFTRIMDEVRKTGHNVNKRTDSKTKAAFTQVLLPFDKLNAIDADISLHARNIKARDAMLEFGELTLRVDDGQLRMDTLEATYGETRISAKLDIHAGPPARVSTRFLVQGFELGRFLKETHISDAVEVKADIAADLGSLGRSAHDLASNLDGAFAVVFGKGKMPRFLDLLAEDLSRRVISIWGPHKESGNLNCGVIQFAVQQGVATSNAFLFDTQIGYLKGKGSVNLGTGKIDFLLSPHPRDASLFSLKTKLRISGSILDPVVRPDTKSLAIKASKALSTLVIGPAGLLAPFVSLGAKNRHPCDMQALRSRLDTIYP